MTRMAVESPGSNEPALVEDRPGVARAHSACPELSKAEHGSKGAHSAGGLHADALRAARSQELNVLLGRSSRTETRGGLDPIGAEFAANLAQSSLFQLDESGSLEDGLHSCTSVLRELHERSDLSVHVVPGAALDAAQIHDEVQLLTASIQRVRRLEDLGSSRVRSMGKTDGRARAHATVPETLEKPRHVKRESADTRDVVFESQIDPTFELIPGHLRAEKAVVDHLGDLLVSVVGHPAAVGQNHMAESRLAFAALLIVPLGAALAFALMPRSESTSRPRTSSPPARLDDSSLESERAMKDLARDSSDEQSALRDDESPRTGSADARDDEEVELDQAPDEPDEWDRHIGNFDDNAKRFDQRLATFEREAQEGRMNLLLGTRVTSAVREGVLELAPEATVKAVCSASVCEVEIRSEEPVGRLVADLGPWLVEWPDGATGDPRAADSRNSFRLLFDANDAPRLEP